MGAQIAKKFAPQHPVSLFVIQGDADPLVPFGGGEVGRPGGRKRGKFIATSAMIAKYVKANGITGKPTKTMLPDKDTDDKTTTDVTRYPPGTQGALIQLYVIKNGGHAWPGRRPYASDRLIGNVSQDFDATEVIWQFFESCPPRDN
jgi:polyhydroxybutyrate depolymerase